MRLVALILALSTCAAADERTVTLVNGSSPMGLQEIATVLRTVVSISKLGLDAKNRSFDVEGTAAQLDASAWLISQLDKPAGWQPSEQEKENPSTREFRLPPTRTANVLRIYYLPQSTTLRGMQETLTILRTVLDLQKIFNYSTLHALVYVGTPVELDAVEWLLQSLSAGAVSAPYLLTEGTPRDLVRVFPLPAEMTAQQVQQLLTELRMKALSIRKVSR